MRKIIINACITGNIITKKDTPFVPITIKEIVKDALEVAKEGASIVHIHARDRYGLPTWKRDYFEKIIGGIKEKNDNLIICVTTSGRLWSDFEKRVECLNINGDLKPDMASLTLGSMNFIHDASVNTPQTIERLALKMKEKGIKPELEVFEPGMINKANYLIGKGIIDKRKPYFNLFFGSLGTSPFHHSIVSAYLALLPQDAIWSGAGIGRFQIDANILSMSIGGGVRVGIEDNIYFDRNEKILRPNSAFVKRINKIAKMMDIEVANANNTRELLL